MFSLREKHGRMAETFHAYSIDMFSLWEKHERMFKTFYAYLARQGIHINRINTNNINQSP
jgi:hypothetical protein